MAVTQAKFNEGMTYEQALEKMPRNKPQIEKNEGLINLTDADLAPWRSLPETLNLLVLVIDPCPDVYTNLPIINRIARETGKLNIRIFMRDDNKDLMAQFMNGPYESVPAMAFYDQSMNLKSVFIERPKNVTELRAQKTREIQEGTPEFGPVGKAPADMPEDVRGRFSTAINEMRAATLDYYINESIREFREIAEELGRGVSGEARWRGNLLAAATA
jgi:hypothetical protein